MPGVKEDVTELILNIKELVVSSEHDEPVVDVPAQAGPRRRHRRATSRRRPASRCTTPTCTSPRSTARASSRWSSPSSAAAATSPPCRTSRPGQEIGRIPVDSIYSPVLKVTYKVEATRVEQRTDFDRLIVDVETKPSMTPRDAMASAGKTLVELFGLARELNVEAEGIDIGPSPTDAALAGRPGAADRGARPHRPVVQLPQARGHPHRRRARRAQRGGPARHPQLRREVDRRGQGQAALAWAWRSRTARPGSTRARPWTATAPTTTQAYVEDEQLLSELPLPTTH